MRPDLRVSDHNPIVINLKARNFDDRVQENDRVTTYYLRNEEAKTVFRASILGNAEDLGLENFQRLSFEEMCRHVEGWVETACRASQTKQNRKGLVQWWTFHITSQNSRSRPKCK